MGLGLRLQLQQRRLLPVGVAAVLALATLRTPTMDQTQTHRKRYLHAHPRSDLPHRQFQTCPTSHVTRACHTRAARSAQHQICTTSNLHYIRCTARSARPNLHHIRCHTRSATPDLHHIRCTARSHATSDLHGGCMCTLPSHMVGAFGLGAFFPAKAAARRSRPWPAGRGRGWGRG